MFAEVHMRSSFRNRPKNFNQKSLGGSRGCGRLHRLPLRAADALASGWIEKMVKPVTSWLMMVNNGK